MPLPWTKNRVTRLSQIVADLQSPKRCPSLVVETGFPTSLIDLFSKNRTRFRKPKPNSNNKPVHRQFSDPPPPHLPEAPISGGFTVVCAESRSVEASPSLVTGNVRGNDGVPGSGRWASWVGKSSGGSGSKMVLASLLEMLTVVVLIASVEKLTVGITVSAFALLLLEYVGKRVVLCSNANGICSCVWFHKLQLGTKKECGGPEPAIVEGDTDNIVLSDLVVEAECGTRTDSLYFQEIEVVETRSEVGGYSEETSCVGLKLDCVSGDNRKWGCPEMQEDSNGEVVDSCDVSLRETKGSRSVKFKSKMKKLLPKNLRGSRKEGKKRRGKKHEAGISSEGLSTGKKDKSPSFEIGEEQKEEVDSGSRSLKIKLEYITENEVDHAVTFSRECSLGRVEAVTVNSEHQKIGSVGNSGYIILFVIVLVGLVVGRLPALILTMAWCFMLKMVTTRGNFKAPLIKCSVPKSWQNLRMVFGE